MGQSTNAMLMYGYHLGGPDGGWEIQQADEFGGLDVNQIPWLRLDDESDFITQAEQKLLESVGFTETDWQADGYFDRERAAEARLGVTFESHCSGDYPMWVLAAAEMTAYRGDARIVDLAALAQQVADEGWDDKLAAAVEALGITPKQAKPAWLLCSYWG